MAYPRGVAGVRAAQKRETRQRLLDAGLEMFRRQGYAATTVDDIATSAGTTRVTFYAHFATRSALMSTLVDEQLNERLARIRSNEHGSTALGLVTAVRDGSRVALHTWLVETAERWPSIHPIIRIGREAAAVEPQLRDLVDRWMEEAISDISDGLTQAGRFEPHQRHFKGVLAMAQLDYVAQHWDRVDWRISREQMLDELTDSWVALLSDPL